MLYELARRLQSQGRSAAEIRAELQKAGAKKEEIDVLLGSLGLSASTHTSAPELLNKTTRVTSSRWVLGLLFALFLAGALPLLYVLRSLIEAAKVGR